MSKLFIAKISVEIKADKTTVWKALTTPELIKQYFFGTDAVSDWNVGSPIYFRGEWEGKKYEDKGTILEIQWEKMFKYNYWSSMSGTAEIPENYANITYELSPKENFTVLTILQDGIDTEERKTHSEQNWGFILDGLKKMLEK